MAKTAEPWTYPVLISETLAWLQKDPRLGRFQAFVASDGFHHPTFLRRIREVKEPRPTKSPFSYAQVLGHVDELD